MALIFGSGEPTSRLRRALDVKGKVNLGLDETVVPVVVVGEYQNAPFRTSGVQFFGALRVAGVAATSSRVRLNNLTDVDAVIRRIWLSNPVSAFQVFHIGTGPVGVAGGSNVFTTERVDTFVLGTPSRQLGLNLIGDTISPTSLSRVFHRLSVPALTSLEVPCELVVPSRLGAITIETLGIQTNIEVGFEGVFIDDIPRLATS